MATTIEDIQYDEMLAELHHEAMMRKEAMKQCIYILVEGESEEVTFKSLLEDCGLDFKEHGVVIANYNGIGNLRHAIRLLKMTLTHDRPIVVTFDDDIEGKAAQKHIKGSQFTPFKVPFEPVVTYKNGSSGGSFEECFAPDCFISSCFEADFVPASVRSKEPEFREYFDPTRPWLAQFAKFLDANGGCGNSINKVHIAKAMTSKCSPAPETFEILARTIIGIRDRHPIENPNDVEISLFR